MSSAGYTLPHALSKRCLDRFSILDIDEQEDGLVSFWQILEEVLRQPVRTTARLIDVLDTISCTLQETSGVADDYGTLRRVVDQTGSEFFQVIWPNIVQHALSLKQHFPDAYVLTLGAGDTLALSQSQTASLVSHQFLCTLECPSWRDGYHDFSIWYGSEQRHSVAAEMYLASLFEYFKMMDSQGKTSHQDEGDTIMFKLNGSALDSSVHSPEWKQVALTQLKVVRVPCYSSDLQRPERQGSEGAVVVSANKDIGFGQSATQEEVFVGNTPEACPAVLFVPTLKDDCALLIEGARPMITIQGQRRDVSWEVLPVDARIGGRMLFMDALEIDELDQDDGLLPDLEPGHMEREIRKAFAAFSSYGNSELDGHVWSGIWGCGAFNGDPVVKMILVWIAASLSRKDLFIVCDPFYQDFADTFERFAARAQGNWNAMDLWIWLGRIPRNTKRLETLRLLQDIVQEAR